MLHLNGEPVDPAGVGRMVDAIRHRGPDGRGLHVDRELGLGHARLSIIDLEGGRQPMSNEDGSIWITCNGEIFNYLELREELTGKGHRFRTASDTEVILHLYEEQGEDCVGALNGQWAFAVWDARRRRLFLARDRLGVRPLFYARGPSTFLFASEVKALLTHSSVEREIDLEALDQIFTFWCTLPPRTMFRGIRELPPAHCLVLQDGALRTWRYWGLDYEPRQDFERDECAAELIELLADATRIRLRADVPVGTYLSGGLDSSVVTALVQRRAPSNLRAFCINFDDPLFDEATYQRSVTDHLASGNRHLTCSAVEIGRAFPAAIRHIEKPVLRTAPAPLYLLARLVHDCRYKVVLTGEGADEVLGGYDIFKETKIRAFCAARPESRRRPLLLRRLYPYLPGLKAQSDEFLRAFFLAAGEEPSDPFFSHLPRWRSTERAKRFFSRGVRSTLEGYSCRDELRDTLPAAFSSWEPFCRAQYLETACLLPGYILSSQGDRVSMAHALEGRFPFLDHRVVEFAATIPPRLKMRGLDEKHVLKRAAVGLVPAAVLGRRKQPYRAPEAASFFDAESGAARFEYVDALLSPERVRQDGLFSPEAVRVLVEKARRGRLVGTSDSMALVGILSTQLWVSQFVRGAAATEMAHVESAG